MVYCWSIFVIEYHHEAIRLQCSLQIERVGSYLFPFLPALVACSVWIEIDGLIYGRRSKELVHLCHEVVVILGQEGKELLDDIETPAVIFLLCNNERLEVARVISHVERFMRVVMKKVLCRKNKPILQVQAKDGLILIAILELMLCVVVVDEELICNLLVSDGTDGREELVDIKGIELRLEELRPEDILVTE